MKQYHPGVHLAGRYGDFRCGCWLLEHKGRCAVVETPPWRRSRNPINALRRFIRARQRSLRLDWILLSHAHIDHAGALADFAAAFPEARLLVHASFLDDPLFSWMFVRHRSLPLHVWDGPQLTLELGGEPLHLLHAPKHSWTDVMTVFRGMMISGDWWLGPGDPNPSGIPGTAALNSIDRLLDFSRDYGIHALFSAHANDIRHGVDFGAIMRSTRDWHQALLQGGRPRSARRRRR